MSTEMVSSLLNPEARGNVKIPVEHLDYNYIQNCTDLKYLEKIVAVLRSGEEGMYPHLTEFCEKHIEKLNPRSRALWMQRPPARAADFSLEEWREIMEDVKTWEANVKSSEIELGKLTCMYREETMPPVRGAKVSFPIKQNQSLSASGTKRRSVLPRDYQEWDRFDVEEECSKIDDNTKQNNFPTMINQCLPKIKQKLDTAGLTEKEKIMLANREKAKGNEAFQANDYEEAVAYYTRSVSVMPTVTAHNNRAQAEIKLQQWHNALRDCQKALEMEPNNLKALLRRATVQNRLGDLEAAADDLRKVLQTESQNAVAKKMLQEVEDKVSARAARNHGRGRRILIEEEEEEEERDEPTEDKEDEYERVPPAKPSLCAGGESAAAPAAERPDMGNAQKKSPGRAEGAPQGDAGAHRRSKRGSVELNRAQQPRDKELVNGGRPAAGSCSAHQDSAGAGDSRTGAGACGDSGGRLDAPSGALPPPLARLKNEGNQLFKNGQFGDALEKYSQAISGFLDSGVDSPEDLCILYSNRAACYLKDGNSTDCIQDCTRALELQPFSLKPLLRRAMANESLERYRMAYVDYKTVLQIDVGVQAAHDSIHRITKLLIEQDGPNWREKLPEIPLVPLSAQQHRREEPPSAELQQARAARAAEEAARKAEVRFSSLKQQGNDCVKKGQFEEALTHYSECVKLKPDECAIYTNRALCYLKVERFAQAKEDCDSALQLESSNMKAFYRRAMAYKGLKDYLACSSDLQEVLHLDPNVQEAERELEEVTVLLRQSLAAGSPNKPRRNVPISEVDGSDEEDAMNKNSNNNHGSSQPAAKHSKSTPLHPSNAYEFSQAMNSARSQDDVAAAAEILRNVEPETLPLYVSNQLDGDGMHFLTRALEHLLQQDPILVFQHLNHLHKADRFSMVLMLLGQSERSQMTSLFEHLAAVESKGFTANDVQNLANKYI